MSGKSLPFWAVGMSIVATDISAMDFVGVSGQSYRFGLAVGSFGWLGSMPVMLLAAFIAFFIELLLTDEHTGEPIVPVFWQDNYVTLLPNETRVLFAVSPAQKEKPALTVRGWNMVSG